MSDAIAFNMGLPQAAELRERVLRGLGAEDDYLGRGADGTGLLWRHSELGTLLELLPVPGGASSVAVLRVTTPVSTVGDLARAAALCDRRNGESTLNRWVVGPWPAIPEREDDEEPYEDDGFTDQESQLTPLTSPIIVVRRAAPDLRLGAASSPSASASAGASDGAAGGSAANDSAANDSAALGDGAGLGDSRADGDGDSADTDDHQDSAADDENDAPEAASLLYLSCSLVVGRRQQPADEDDSEDEEPAPGGLALLELAMAAVGDQIATAVAALGAGLHDEVAGVPFVCRGEDGEVRQRRHAVTRYHETLHALSDDDEDTSALWRGLLTAFDELRYDQETDGGPVWGAGDGRGFRCEVPFGWGPFPRLDDRPVEVVMARDEPAGPEAATSLLLASLAEPRPDISEGLLLTMRVPVQAPPGEDMLDLLAALNTQDARDPGAGHGLGAWVLRDEHPTWRVFLPKSLATSGLATTAALAREVLLAAAGASLLARRLLLTDDDLVHHDRRPIGPASRQPQGLAFGADALAGDEPALVLDTLYAGLVGPDIDWSVLGDAGFEWWPHLGRQRLRITPRPLPDGRRAGSLRISTEIATGVRATRDVLRLVARRNAADGRSALVLDPASGVVETVARIRVGPRVSFANRIWARMVAIEQMIEAEAAADALTGLAGLGRAARPAASAHPDAGPRPSRDVLFGTRPDTRERARATFSGALPGSLAVRPLTLPLALTALLAPPHRVSGHEPGRSITAEWWTRTYDPSGPAARCRAELLAVDHPDLGPGVRARTYLDELPGELDELASWCNERNRALLAETAADDLTVVGGWGLDATDTPCLTSWFFPETLLGDHPDELARTLGELLRHQQWLVFVSLASTAVTGGPDEPAGTAWRPSPRADGRGATELAAGLPSLFGAFRAVLDFPPGFTLTAQVAPPVDLDLGGDASPAAASPAAASPAAASPAAASPAEAGSVVVELARPVTPPAHEELMSWPRLAAPTSDPVRPRLLTRIEAPVDGLRGPLALLLTTLASASRTWLPDLRATGERALTVPGHLGNDFRDGHVRDAIGRLLFDGDIVDEPDGDGFLVLAAAAGTEPATRAPRPALDGGEQPDGLDAADEVDAEVGLALADELGLGRGRAPVTVARMAAPYPTDHPFYGSGVMVLDTHLEPAVTRGLAQSAALDRLTDQRRAPTDRADLAELTAALAAISGLSDLPTCGAWIADEKTRTVVYRICLPPSCLLWPAPEPVGAIIHTAWRIAIAQARAATLLLTEPIPEPSR